MRDMLIDLSGFIEDAHAAVLGLRPEDAIIALNNAKQLQEDMRDLYAEEYEA